MTLYTDREPANRHHFIISKTFDDLSQWITELAEFEKALAKLIDDIKTVADSIAKNTQDKQNLDNDFSTENILKRINNSLVLGKTNEGLIIQKVAFIDYQKKIEVAIAEKTQDIKELRTHLETEARTAELEKWINQTYYPAQEEFVKLRGELFEKLQQSHYLKMGGEKLRIVGGFKRLVPHHERTFKFDHEL